MKKCPHCNLTKSMDEFSPCASWCKSCINSRDRAAREKVRESEGRAKYENTKTKILGTSKICSVCSLEKPLDNFPIGSKKCKPCKNAQERETRKDPDYKQPTRDPIYSVWQAMRQRCMRPSHPAYKDYGGRGISVDPRWDSFSQFKEDVGERPHPDSSLDRYPDNDGNYTKENVRWADREEQSNNRRNNRIATVYGMKKTVAEIARSFGVSHSLVLYHVNKGVDGENLVNLIKEHISKRG